ncbi:multi-pass transmembrane protein [Toxoplasma gondii MAS]|uniref:Multi-pass transmembrane protein n=3 Tax=Toxoplasma gondii TaxID=5811 RepID=A0A086QM85_TOXGO|nr:multi-pass transmembrane protein [Toxoplasma gondii FOU]KFH13717.1 multi-pass transmembrane protein [Toxoplasma gondii MAS]RQX74190.1 multi-pass transmembrane protein [Toxoplasma gondii CAST]
MSFSSDQKKHEMTKEIWGHKGEILLSCQWIYSKKLLYSTYLGEFSVRRDVKLREISDYQLEADKLNQPFGTPEKPTRGFFGAFAAGPELLSKLLEQLRVYLKLGSWMATTQHMAALTFCLSCIAGFSRPVFLDQMIAGFTFWNNIDPRRWTVHRYSFLMLCCAVGVLYDVWWMRIYFSAWNLSSVEADIHNITKVFSIFLCIWKCALYMLFWKNRHDLQKKVVHGNELSTATGAYMPLKVEDSSVLGLSSAPRNASASAYLAKGGEC